MRVLILFLILPIMCFASPNIQEIIKKEARDNFLNENLLLAVAVTESALNPNAMGDDGTSIGLMQIKEATADFMKFKGHKSQLRNPKINAKISAQYLRFLYLQTGDIYKTLDAYNRGLQGIRNNPYVGDWYQHKYVGKVWKNFEKIEKKCFNSL